MMQQLHQKSLPPVWAMAQQKAFTHRVMTHKSYITGVPLNASPLTVVYKIFIGP